MCSISTDDHSPYRPFQAPHHKQAQAAKAGMLTKGQQKVIRDGFSMPQRDYRLIDEARNRLFQAGLVVTKSGILRAALHALHQLSIEDRLQLIQELEPIKAGRPEGQKS